MRAAMFGGIIGAGALVIYLPYFLTAQSQAGGFIPNLFNPTHFPQFILMFGSFLLAIAALIRRAWLDAAPTRRQLLTSCALIYGAPVLFLVASAAVALTAEPGQQLLARMALPDGAGSHLPFILQRWASRPFTFLVAGGLLAIVTALIWRRLDDIVHGKDGQEEVQDGEVFALLMVAVGLLLVYAPEFVFLRDNFGTRMNTIFKFYYQAWLLLGLSSAYTIAVAYGRRGQNTGFGGTTALSAFALLLIVVGLIYPVAGVYSKTFGFSAPSPTLDATYYLTAENPAEMAAIEWVRQNVASEAIILEGKGASYWATYNRISAMTGRRTLLGWDGHEAQWRGRIYGAMAQGRPEALEKIYRTGTPEEIIQLLTTWAIDYVYIGPTERSQYGITTEIEERLKTAMDLVFESGDVRIYRR
jgi:uncharacterized membrane protein